MQPSALRHQHPILTRMADMFLTRMAAEMLEVDEEEADEEHIPFLEGV